jgi:DNA-binding MarR family transcriptional regulator
MTLRDASHTLIVTYPKIFFACHARHRRDPATGRLVSAHQASIIDHLDDVDPTMLTVLARHMGVTPSTTSLNIDRLEGKGYVVRKRDPFDARRVNLFLTAAGLRLKNAQSVLEPQRVRLMLKQLTPKQRDEALNGLALLAQAAQAMMHEHANALGWVRKRSDRSSHSAPKRREQ